jgi:hypothetical protein
MRPRASVAEDLFPRRSECNGFFLNMSFESGLILEIVCDASKMVRGNSDDGVVVRNTPDGITLYSAPSTSSTVEAGSRAEWVMSKHIARDPEAKESYNIDINSTRHILAVNGVAEETYVYCEVTVPIDLFFIAEYLSRSA